MTPTATEVPEAVFHSAQGRDVSPYQPVQTVADWAGYNFGFCKATEGTGWTAGANFTENWANLEVCVTSRKDFPLRGAYHFLHPASDPVAQARYFMSMVKAAGLKPGDALVVDSEILAGISADGKDLVPGKPMRRSHLPVTEADLALIPEQVDAATLAFCDEAARLGGKVHPVIVYTMHEVGQHLVKTAAKYPLWFAWPSNTAPPAGMIAPWKDWLLWQWSWAGGNRGDLDAFNGTVADLAAFVAKYLPPKFIKVHKKLLITADGTESLRQVAHRYQTNVGWVISWTFRNLPWSQDRHFGAYVISGKWDAPLPKGTEVVVWAWVEEPVSPAA